MKSGKLDSSGSCAIIALIIGTFDSCLINKTLDKICYVANIGDSRAVLSSEYGKTIVPLSRDHKPTDQCELTRIKENGGNTYHTKGFDQTGKFIRGPLRVWPGRLSVSRTFGDASAKVESIGGKQGVVIATPEIIKFKI
jgi:protein phosphatase 2C family protein 2/3